MKKKFKIITLIKILGIIIIISIGASIIIFDLVYSYKSIRTKAEKMRTEYIEKQKDIVKTEVKRVIELLNNRNYRIANLLTAFDKIKSEIAWNFINNYFDNYKSIEDKKKIKNKLIKKLKFMVTDDSDVYIYDFDNKSLINLKDKTPECEIPINSLLEYKEYTNKSNFYYYCKKTNHNDSVKIYTYYKYFKGLNWLIISQVNKTNDFIFTHREAILYDISRIRFGKEGYIFINTFDGDALVSNGKLIKGSVKLWDAFDFDKDKMKEIFRKEYEAAMKPDGDFINYTWKKLTDLNRVSKKTSFIQSYPEFRWIVGAGFYHDEIEKEINAIYKELNNDLKTKVIVFIIVVTVIILAFLIIFNKVMNKLNREFSYFISFFGKATETKEKINLNSIQFIEFEEIAKNANRMLSELWDSQNKLITMIQASPDPIYFKDVHGTISMANKSYLNLYDLKEEDIVNKNFNEIVDIINPIYKNTFSACKKSDLKAWTSGKDFYVSEETVEKPNGDILTFEVIKVPVFDENGEKKGLLVIGRDITARKKIENNLRKMETVIEQSPVSIVIINKNIEIEYVNNKYCETREYTKEELLGKNPNFLIYDTFTNEELRKMRSELVKGKIWTGEILSKTKTGKKYWENVIVFPIYDENKEITHYVVIKEDITKRKKLELQLKEANENLKAQIERELEKIRMQENIIQQQKRFADMGQMVNAIAHQWRQPLNNISLIMQMIKSIYDGEDYDIDINELFKQQEEVIRFMSKTIDDFRNYFSVNKEKTEFSIIREIWYTVSLLRAQLNDNNIDLKVFCKCSESSKTNQIIDIDEYNELRDIFYGLSGEFRQVILNIISNAKDAILDKRKEGWSGGYIEISLFIKKDEFEIVIFNTGDPIEKEILDKIFDPYFTTKGHDKGTGIGLYMSKTIIENEMKGSIFAENHNNGVEFHIILPKTKKM